MRIVPYESVGPLRFDESNQDDCIQRFGEPDAVRKSRTGKTEMCYERFIVRFDSSKHVMIEVTLLPFCEGTIRGVEITWDHCFLSTLCKMDSSALNIFGFIVFLELGVAVSGIHDNDHAQLAISAFRRGDFDGLVAKGMPFSMSECVEND